VNFLLNIRVFIYIRVVFETFAVSVFKPKFIFKLKVGHGSACL